MDPENIKRDENAETLLKELLIESAKIYNEMHDDHGSAILGLREDDPQFLEHDWIEE
ncbi:MAG: hypothetical protein H7A40_02530 [Chlamydiales bacterium]|nr:hypothetical protein [Chlamydiales bacterium]